MTSISPTLEAEARRIVAALETAWNEGNAAAFAGEFASDADFVNVRGDHASGREAIAQGHDHIWSTVYVGSSVRYAVTQVREIAPGVGLVHVDALLRVPSGPAAGDTGAIPSLVLVQRDGAWKIASFHNTHRRRE